MSCLKWIHDFIYIVQLKYYPSDRI